ncbi:MAG: inner rane protein [Clostridiales bacterium]|jgi:inner membrane protein|nr:inner rane protein [Clostridiales bacterium]
MDPITHAVIGAAISKFSGNAVAVTDPATLAVVIGSVFPDADILMQKWGDYAYLKNHRGASHSLLGLIASSLLIGAALSGIYHGAGFIRLSLWALLGCFSHTFFDIFNSYGAQLLWPFKTKKFSLSLLLAFDPIFIGTLIGYIVSSGGVQTFFLEAFIAHLISRILMRIVIRVNLQKKFKGLYDRISILPSMTGLFRWCCILENDTCSVVGESNILGCGIKIIKKLDKIQKEDNDKVLLTPVGQFFKEFTPLFHIKSEKAHGSTKYTFIDMRYYIRNNFLHHAILELDENDLVVRASFNPYSLKRNCIIKGTDIQTMVQTLNI